MRRFLIALTLLIGASACQRIEEKFEQTRVEFEVNDVQVAETRAEYDKENHALKWKAGDVIGGYAASTTNSMFTNKKDSENKFSGVVFGTPSMMYLYYPYAEDASEANHVVTLTYPAVQTLKADDFGTNPPMTAMAAGFNGRVDFVNQFGVVMFTIKNAADYDRKLSKVEFVANGGETIAGTYSMDMTPAKLGMQMTGANASSMITMVGSVDVKIGEECSFLLALPPTTYESGFTFTVYDMAGASQTFEVNRGELVLARNMAVKLDADKGTDGIQSFAFDATPTEVVISALSIPELELNFAIDQDKKTAAASKTGFANPIALDLTVSYGVADPDVVPVVTLNALGGFPEQEATASAEANVVTLTDVNLTMPRTITISYGDYYKKEYTVKLSQLTDTGLPVVYINTPDAAEITSKDDWMPTEPEKGVTLPDGDYTYFYIDASGRKSWDELVNFSDFAPAKSYAKGRGNTTWNYAKKPYAIKLDTKAEVLGLPKHKRWVLLANTIDKSMIRNKLTFLIAEACYAGTGWNPRGHSVELVLNGEHKGNYLLCEQIKIDKNRVNVTEADNPKDAEQGYLLEGDRYWGGDPTETLFWASYRGQTQYAQQFNEENSNVYGTNYYDDGKWTPQASSGDYRFMWGLKGPDDGDLGLESEGGKETAAYQFINAKVTAAEQFLYGPSQDDENYVEDVDYLEKVFKTKTLEELSAYIDVDSFIYYWFVFEIAMNHEPNNPGSVYMHYKDAFKSGDGVGRFHMGPVWDFDWGTYSYTFTDNEMYTNKETHFIIANSLWYHALLKNEAFLVRVGDLWEQTKVNLTDLLASGKLEGMIEYLKVSADYNWGAGHLNWDDIMDECNGDPNKEQGVAFETAAQKVIDNFRARVGHLDALIKDLTATADSSTPKEQN